MYPWDTADRRANHSITQRNRYNRKIPQADLKCIYINWGLYDALAYLLFPGSRKLKCHKSTHLKNCKEREKRGISIKMAITSIKRRLNTYSDWTESLTRSTYCVLLFIFSACLAGFVGKFIEWSFGLQFYIDSLCMFIFSSCRIVYKRCARARSL